MPTRSWCCSTDASSSAAAISNCLTRKANTRGCGRCSNNRLRPRPCSKVQRHCSRCTTENQFTEVLGITAYCLILFAFFLLLGHLLTNSCFSLGLDYRLRIKRL